MIRSAIKNYFKNLKYVFSVMGIVYLALIISVLALLSGVGSILSTAAVSSGEQLVQYLNQTLMGISLEELFADGFFSGFLNGILQIFKEGGDNVVARITTLFTAVLSLFLFGCKLSGWHTRRLIRKDVSDAETKRGLIVLIARYVFGLLGTVLVAICVYRWVFSAIFLLIAFAVVKSGEQLLTTWFVYCKKSFTLKEMFRARYILGLIAANGVSVAVNACFLLLIAAVVNIPFALLVAVPFAIYSFIILDFTTVSYFNRQKALKQNVQLAPTAPNTSIVAKWLKNHKSVSIATKRNQLQQNIDVGGGSIVSDKISDAANGIDTESTSTTILQPPKDDKPIAAAPTPTPVSMPAPVSDLKDAVSRTIEDKANVEDKTKTKANGVKTKTKTNDDNTKTKNNVKENNAKSKTNVKENNAKPKTNAKDKTLQKQSIKAEAPTKSKATRAAAKKDAPADAD